MTVSAPINIKVSWIEETIDVLTTYNNYILIIVGRIGMKQDVGKYLKAIGIKSGEFLDAAKIRFELHSLKRDKEDILFNIGCMVYSMFLKNKTDTKRVEEDCRKIAALDRKIRAKEELIDKIHDSASKAMDKTMNKDHKKNDNKKELVEALHYEVKDID